MRMPAVALTEGDGAPGPEIPREPGKALVASSQREKAAWRGQANLASAVQSLSSSKNSFGILAKRNPDH
jgi:hypothetical protein